MESERGILVSNAYSPRVRHTLVYMTALLMGLSCIGLWTHDLMAGLSFVDRWAAVLMFLMGCGSLYLLPIAIVFIATDQLVYLEDGKVWVQAANTEKRQQVEEKDLPLIWSPTPKPRAVASSRARLAVVRGPKREWQMRGAILFLLALKRREAAQTIEGDRAPQISS